MPVRATSSRPAAPASLDRRRVKVADVKAFVAKALKGRSFKTFEKYDVAKSKLPAAAQKQYEKFQKDFETTFQSPQARQLKIDGQPVFMAAAYNWPYEIFRFVLYDAQGKELARGSGTKDHLKWSPAK